MRAEAKLRIAFEEQARTNKRYKTVFLGLKLNAEHGSTVMQPIGFLLRRLIYASLIVFIPNEPFISGLLLLCLSTIALLFTIVEKPWKDLNHHSMVIFNEVTLYAILLVIMSVAIFSDIEDSEAYGYLIIGLFTLNIFGNLLNILCESWNFIKLLYLKHQNSKIKITPLNMQQKTKEQQQKTKEQHQ